MGTISEAVEETVKSDMRVYDALRMGITNNRRLAKRIQKDVNNRTGQNTSIGTITVILQRIANRMQTEEDNKYKSILGKSRLQMRDDIRILYLNGNPTIGEEELSSDGFHVKIRGIGTTTILLDEETAERIVYKREDILKEITNLSAIIITSPVEIVETPGVIAHLMTALGGNNINVVEVTSSYDSTFLIVEKRDSLKAVEVVRNMISRARR